MIKLYAHHDERGYHSPYERLFSDLAIRSLKYATQFFLNHLQMIQNHGKYFSWEPWSSDIRQDRPGFYLLVYPDSQTLEKNLGLMCIPPEVVKQINDGILQLLVVFYWETWDSRMTAPEWQDQFCSDLNVLGIQHHRKSVKVLSGTWWAGMNRHLDPRVEWIFHPMIETVLHRQAQLRYQTMPEMAFRTGARPHKYLNLNYNPRLHREMLLIYLEYLGLNAQGLITWPQNAQPKIIDQPPNSIWGNGIKNFPELLKYLRSRKGITGSYPHSGGPPIWLDVDHLLPQCSVELVNETHHDIGNIVFLTEKTFRPLALGLPIILNGSRQSLRVLKLLGYRTFSDFWSEEYDEIHSPMHHVDAIAQLVKSLCESTDVFENPEIADVVLHNQTNFWGKNHAQRLYQLLQ